MGRASMKEKVEWLQKWHFRVFNENVSGGWWCCRFVCKWCRSPLSLQYVGYQCMLCTLKAMINRKWPSWLLTKGHCNECHEQAKWDRDAHSCRN
jgi:hypothetical protein